MFDTKYMFYLFYKDLLHLAVSQFLFMKLTSRKKEFFLDTSETLSFVIQSNYITTLRLTDL